MIVNLFAKPFFRGDIVVDHYDLREGDDMTVPRMKKIKAGDIRLQTAEWAGKGGPVFCIHGLTSNSRTWDSIAAALSGKYRIIAMDLRGRGMSDKPGAGYSVDIHARDLDALLDVMKIKKTVIMGHSLGAVIGLYYAAKHPERVKKLILIDGAGKLTKKQTEMVLKGIMPSLERLGKVFPSFEDYVRPLKQAPFLRPWTSTQEDFYRYEMKRVKDGIISRVRLDTIHEELMNLVQGDVCELYPGVECPVLVLRASMGMLRKDDVLLPKGALKKMIRGLNCMWLVEIPGANHYSIMFDRNRIRDRSIINFLES